MVLACDYMYIFTYVYLCILTSLFESVLLISLVAGTVIIIYYILTSIANLLVVVSPWAHRWGTGIMTKPSGVIKHGNWNALRNWGFNGKLLYKWGFSIAEGYLKAQSSTQFTLVMVSPIISSLHPTILYHFMCLSFHIDLQAPPFAKPHPCWWLAHERSPHVRLSYPLMELQHTWRIIKQPQLITSQAQYN